MVRERRNAAFHEGGAIEIKTSRYKCIGRCGKEWPAIWDSAQRNHSPTGPGNKLSAILPKPQMIIGNESAEVWVFEDV